MQLSLNFPEHPPPAEPLIWERLDDRQRRAVIEQLARLLAKAALANARRGPGDD